MSGSGLSAARLRRMRDILARHVESGSVPGLVALVERRGEVHVEALGVMEAGGSAPMPADAIFRIASLTKHVTAVATMILVEECLLRLDDPIDEWLPELSGRRVLREPSASLDDTVPALRPISVRDLLTFRMGLGEALEPNSANQAMREAGLSAGPHGPSFGPEEWIKRLGALPLAAQPGEQWFYNTGSDVLGVLISRVTGRPLGEFYSSRIFEPLGMTDTAFHVPPAKLDRLPAAYRPDPVTGSLERTDGPENSRWAAPPAFFSGAGGPGLVSTAADLHAFYAMLRNGGVAGGRRILARPTIELMTTDQLTDEQKAANAPFFGGSSGWGLGFNVVTRRDDVFNTPGRYGWTGGTGTTAYTDPAEDLTGILLTQRYMTSPVPPKVFVDFWTGAYQAIDD